LAQVHVKDHRRADSRRGEDGRQGQQLACSAPSPRPQRVRQ
jgi:hypothetical protein